MVNFLTIIEIAAIQQDQIDRYGGIHGIRDKGALESACARPQSSYYKDIVEMAAALMESLAMNHPFLDGNKRTAFAATYTFLKINNYYIKSDWKNIHDFIMGLFNNNEFNVEKLKNFLQKNTQKIF